MRLLLELFRKGIFSLKLSEAKGGGDRRHHFQEREYQSVGVSLTLHAVLLPPTNSHNQLHSTQPARDKGAWGRGGGFYRPQRCSGLRKKAPDSLTLQGSGVYVPPLEFG